MKRIVAVLAVVAAVGVAMAAAKGTAVFSPADGLKWVDMPGGPLKSATVEGDASKGAHHFFLKLPAGFVAPAHHHTPDHFGTVISGTMVLSSEGKEEKLTPGSYFGFTGKGVHTTKCEAGADCVLFIDSRGKWDVVMEDAKAKN
jgi:quercetin dioxygenase-like cupin family protein